MRGARDVFDADGRSTLSGADEAAFYGSLKMRNGTFKTTSAARFADIDPEIARIVARRFPGSVALLDVAVSAGVSTLELIAALRCAGTTPSATATDLYLEGRLLDLGRGMTVLTDRKGWPLQYRLGPWAIRPWVRRLDFLTGTAPVRMALAWMLTSRLADRIARGEGQAVALVSRAVASSAEIVLVEDDVTVPRPDFQGCFQFIRAANILNHGYFSETNLKTAVGNLSLYLSGPGALLLVTRSEERTGVNHATLFQLSERGRLEVVCSFGKGSEIASVVLTLPKLRDGPSRARPRPDA